MPEIKFERDLSHWSACVEKLQERDKEFCDAWRAEIENFLLYVCLAGLPAETT